MKLVLAVLLAIAVCSVAYPQSQQRNHKFHQPRPHNVNQDYPDDVNTEDGNDNDYNDINSMDNDYDQFEGQDLEGKSFNDINFVRNMDDYDQPAGGSNQVENMEDYPDFEDDSFRDVNSMDGDDDTDYNPARAQDSGDDYDQPTNGYGQSMTDYGDSYSNNIDQLKESDFESQNQYEDWENFQQQGTTSQHQEEQAAMEEYNKLRSHEVNHELGQKYNNEDYSNKMRAMEDDFESLKDANNDDYDQSQDSYRYNQNTKYQGDSYDGGYGDDSNDDFKYMKNAKYQDDDDDDDGGYDDMKYMKNAKYQDDDDDDDDGGYDDMKYMKYQDDTGDDDGDYNDDVKYANKYQSRNRLHYNSRHDSQKFDYDDGDDQMDTQQDYDDLVNANTYQYNKREVDDKLYKEEIKVKENKNKTCDCSSKKSLFAIKDPQEYWFKKVPSSLNLPTLTFNLTGVPKDAKEILIHVMVHSGWQDKGSDYVGQVVLSTIKQGRQSFQEGVMFYPYANDEANSYSTAHVALPVTDERRVHIIVAPPAPKGTLHNISIKIKVVAYRI